ncbi:MAG: rod shape-determining protein MreD [Calditrichaeota bacterium]|nr:rod shape-determining protein MreD [Calditrichota bacterium]
MSIISFIKYLILALLLIWVETGFLHLFSIYGATPDLILILVLLVSFREDRVMALLVAFVAGLLQDVFATHFWGLSALTKLIVALIGSNFQRADRDYPLTYFAGSFLLLIFIHEILHQFLFSLGSEMSFWQVLWRSTIPGTIYTFVISLVIYFLFQNRLWQTKMVKSF